jgi:hypothetical protein
MGFFSFDSVVTDFSERSDFSLAEDGFRTGVLVLGVADAEGSCFDAALPADVGCESTTLLLDRRASLVENMRVRRFVIEGFSSVAGTGLCGSAGGAVGPFRLSVLETDMAFWAGDGRDSGDAALDEACDVDGEGRTRCAATVAMMSGVVSVAQCPRARWVGAWFSVGEGGYRNTSQSVAAEAVRANARALVGSGVSEWVDRTPIDVSS